jgi:hypothetical protein
MTNYAVEVFGTGRAHAATVWLARVPVAGDWLVLDKQAYVVCAVELHEYPAGRAATAYVAARTPAEYERARSG